MKNLIYLSTIVLLAAASFYLVNKPKRSTHGIDREMFMTDSLKLAEIKYSSLSLEYTLLKQNGDWMIKLGEVHKADREKIRKLTEFLADLKLTNIISENSDRFNTYGVDSTGIFLKLTNTDGSVKSFIIGKDDSYRRNTFYRKEDENIVYTGSLFPRYRLPDSVEQWISLPEENENTPETE